jgi:hypothetical protein
VGKGNKWLIFHDNISASMAVAILLQKTSFAKPPQSQFFNLKGAEI